ncbi:class I SAM-dependent methyltransferase [Candidatus Micrarchaeota archaeon]|nr:class I SAM-dependent methyltransferase [Candidatus Micrarchaeota archaeon]
MQTEWDAIATEWDENRTKPSATLALFKGYGKGTVLDAGCGNGRNAAELAKTAEQVIALDASAEMLKATEMNLGPKTAHAENIKLVHAKIEKLPLEDASIDSVFCIAALHHIKPAHHKRAFFELFRVLKEGGHLCMTVWNGQQKRFKNKPKEQDVPWHGKPRYYYFFDESELIDLLQGAGFKVEKTMFEKDGNIVPPKEAQNLCMVVSKP